MYLSVGYICYSTPWTTDEKTNGLEVISSNYIMNFVPFNFIAYRTVTIPLFTAQEFFLHIINITWL